MHSTPPTPSVTFAEQVVDLLPRLLGAATALVGPGADAEDLVADTVAAALPRSGAAVASPYAYLRRAMVNRHIDQLRRAERHRRATAELQVRADMMLAAPDPDLADVLAVLSGRARTIVHLRYLEDLSVRQVAELMGLPEGTVRRVTHEAVGILRQAMAENGDRNV